MKTVVILSGGMDSAVTLAEVIYQGGEVRAVTCDYGQSHGKMEIQAAELLCKYYNIPWELANLQGSFPRGESALTGGEEVPKGWYDSESMKSTVVVGRNASICMVGANRAIPWGADRVAVGVHAGDHAIYPDCRPLFIESFNLMIRIATEGFRTTNFHVYAPFVDMTKADIVKIGSQLKVPFDLTYSCYVGGPRHCSTCGTCSERRAAFREAGVKDPTDYELSEAEFDSWLKEQGIA